MNKIEELFVSLQHMGQKTLRGKPVEKSMVVNDAIEEKSRFLRHRADRKVTYGTGEGAHIRADHIITTPEGVRFSVRGVPYALQLVGSFNVLNALGALAVARVYDLPDEAIRKGLQDLAMVPGRMESIDVGQPYAVFVDYAHDGPSIEAACVAAREIADNQKGKVLLLLGGEGGGRDTKKRPVMGTIAAERADYVVVTNVDPYDDNPQEIIEDIARASEAHGKIRGKNLFTIEDRRLGIRQALALAGPHDVVLITGKGSEQSLIIGSFVTPWDDRTVTRAELTALNRP